MRERERVRERGAREREKRENARERERESDQGIPHPPRKRIIIKICAVLSSLALLSLSLPLLTT